MSMGKSMTDDWMIRFWCSRTHVFLFSCGIMWLMEVPWAFFFVLCPPSAYMGVKTLNWLRWMYFQRCQESWCLLLNYLNPHSSTSSLLQFTLQELMLFHSLKDHDGEERSWSWWTCVIKNRSFNFNFSPDSAILNRGIRLYYRKVLHLRPHRDSRAENSERRFLCTYYLPN